MKLSLLSVPIFLSCAFAVAEKPQTPAEVGSHLKGPFAPELEAKFAGLDYDGLREKLPKRDYLAELDFDPTTARYFDLAKEELALTEKEIATFRKHGFVNIEQSRYQTPTTVYYSIYSSDLPVLITTDSILYALHKSYDEILKEIEEVWIWETMKKLLAEVHSAVPSGEGALQDSCRDVDLYLSVACRLLDPRADVRSRFGQDGEVQAILDKIASLKLEDPRQDDPTELYGGTRYMDYSQFKPRGHYTKSLRLRDYFRVMMWLGRADTGWNVLPPDPRSGIVSDSPRELRSAVTFAQLLEETGNLETLRKVDRVVAFMVGKSDSLNVFQLRKLMQEHGVASAADLLEPAALKKFQGAIAKAEAAKQHIRSQVIVSPRNGSEVFPPATFQVFGQRFAIDSYVLSRVVFDSIFSDGKKQERFMPTGLDVMAALGNESAVPLLEVELLKWKYSANLLAGRTFVEQQPEEFWQESLYSLWLGALRTIDADLSGEKHAPQAMRTRTWQRKQLQTQLASWSQLRHDTILYAKQSYGAMPGCEYPSGYVEPYPEFYASLAFFAKRAGELIGEADYAGEKPGPNAKKEEIRRHAHLSKMQKKQVAFFANMQKQLGQLEILARKELAAEPFTREERDFLSKTISHYGSQPKGSGSSPAYSGWYVGLFYKDWNNGTGNFGRRRPGESAPPPYGRSDMRFEPTIADVHTDPEKREVLEVGVGPINLCVIAVDCEDDRLVYVGPVMSYHEFPHPVEKRLTDGKWSEMLTSGQAPGRPEWTRSFAVAAPENPRRVSTMVATMHPNTVIPEYVKEKLAAGKKNLNVRPQRVATRGESAVLRVSKRSGQTLEREWLEMSLTDEGLAILEQVPVLRALDLSHSAVTDAGLAALSHLPELRNLFLTGTKIEGAGLVAVQDAPWLRRVVLANSSVNDAGVARLVPLPRLEILDLGGTKVTNAAVDHLEKMVYLRELNVENTSLDSSAVARLQKALPKCDIRSGTSGKSAR